MHTAIRVLPSVVAAVLCSQASASAADYFVAQQSTSCNDTGPGTEAAPWCTVQKAADTMVAGDTVWVAEGIYREAVVPASSGEAGRPIRYLARAGERVVLTGADPVTGWQACTAGDCPDLPATATAYFADLDWTPAQLFEQGTRLERARLPNDDYWVAEGGGTTTLVDTQHLCADCLPGLTQTDTTWLGATLVFWKHDMGIHSARTVIGFDVAAGELTLDDVIYSDWVVEAGVDTYYLENHLAALDAPGEWVAHPGHDESARVFLVPLAGTDPNDLLVEGSRRSRFLIEYGTKGYLRVEGFEIAQGAGHGIGSWSDPYPEGIEIVGNVIHDNLSTGVYLRETPGAVVRDNEIYANEIGLSGGPRSTIDHNRIHHNRIDGLWPGDHALVTRNVIAHHNNLNHPDNIQTCCGESGGIVFDGNLILNGGQCFMLEMTSNSVVRNNAIVGSCAYCLIFGDGTVNDWEVTGNTFGLTGYGAVRMEGSGYVLRDNVFFTAGTSSAFAAPEAGLESDYNLFFAPATNERGAVSFQGETYGGSLDRPFADYQSLSGYDANSREGDPELRGYPVCMAQAGSEALDTVITYDNADCFAVGDHLELDFDGTMRVITAMTADEPTGEATLTIDPPFDRRIWRTFLALNWKEQTDPTLDVRPRASSPACAMSSTGSYVGALPCVGSGEDGPAPWEGGELPVAPAAALDAGGSEGCGCRLGARPSSPTAAWIASLLTLVFHAPRRRGRTRDP